MTKEKPSVFKFLEKEEGGSDMSGGGGGLGDQGDQCQNVSFESMKIKY